MNLLTEKHWTLSENTTTLKDPLEEFNEGCV
jgi:hypothetical protein